MGKMHESQNGKLKRGSILRFPRRNAEDVAFYRAARRIRELEKQAGEWIARGREANLKLGRIFIRLKKLVGRGNFEKYFNINFTKRYGIAFRTAQSYMQLARQADEAQGAESAPYPLAMDPQAMETREATKKAGIAVAKLEQDNPDDENEPENRRENEPKKPSEASICICQLIIHMTYDQREKISALWRSKHRDAVEAAVTDLLMQLCNKHGRRESDGQEKDPNA